MARALGVRVCPPNSGRGRVTRRGPLVTKDLEGETSTEGKPSRGNTGGDGGREGKGGDYAAPLRVKRTRCPPPRKSAEAPVMTKPTARRSPPQAKLGNELLFAREGFTVLSYSWRPKASRPYRAHRAQGLHVLIAHLPPRSFRVLPCLLPSC